MGIQVGYGDDLAFRALVYGADRSPGTLQFIENSVNSIGQMSNTLTEAGNNFFNNSRTLMNQFIGSDAMRLAKAALNKVSNVFVRNDIHYINDIAKLQNAPLVMQRFIMAQPDVRLRYHEQRCDGYSGTYVDMEPQRIGENHYDYRRVMNGIVVGDEDKITYYLDTLFPNDRELDLNEQVDVLKTWEVVARLMKYGDEDPTSVMCESL